MPDVFDYILLLLYDSILKQIYWKDLILIKAMNN